MRSLDDWLAPIAPSAGHPAVDSLRLLSTAWPDLDNLPLPTVPNIPPWVTSKGILADRAAAQSEAMRFLSVFFEASRWSEICGSAGRSSVVGSSRRAIRSACPRSLAHARRSQSHERSILARPADLRPGGPAPALTGGRRGRPARTNAARRRLRGLRDGGERAAFAPREAASKPVASAEPSLCRRGPVVARQRAGGRRRTGRAPRCTSGSYGIGPRTARRGGGPSKPDARPAGGPTRADRSNVGRASPEGGASLRPHRLGDRTAENRNSAPSRGRDDQSTQGPLATLARHISSDMGARILRAVSGTTQADEAKRSRVRGTTRPGRARLDSKRLDSKKKFGGRYCCRPWTEATPAKRCAWRGC